MVCSLQFLLLPAMMLTTLEDPLDVLQCCSMLVVRNENGTGDLHEVLKYQHVTLPYAMGRQGPRK